MKLIYLVVIMFSFYSAQCQKKESTVYFRDGTKKQCVTKIKNNQILIFDEKGNKSKFNYREISKLKTEPKYGTGTFEYKIKIGYSEPILLELIEENRLNLYGIEVDISTTIGDMGVTGDVITIKGKGILHFVGKNGESLVTNFEQPNKYGNVWFKKLSKDFFHDCKILVDKIENDEFRRKDFLEIVKFYNLNCVMQ